MKLDGLDRELEAAYGHLREDDTRATPAFGDTLARARRRLESGSGARGAVERRAAPRALAAAAAVAVAAGVALALIGNPGERPGGTTAPGALAPAAPVSAAGSAAASAVEAAIASASAQGVVLAFSRWDPPTDYLLTTPEVALPGRPGSGP